MVKSLTEQVSSITFEVANHRRSRSPTRSRSTFMHRQRSSSSHTLLCDEHFQLKSKASKCCLGCSWSQQLRYRANLHLSPALQKQSSQMLRRLPVSKKLSKSPSLPAGQGDPLCCGLFTLPAHPCGNSTNITPIKFLIDTGSCLSILPLSYGTSSIQSGALRAANNTSIPTFGYVTLSFTLPMTSHTFTWSFTIASTIQPILGSDFLDHYDLFVDCRNLTLNPSTIKKRSTPNYNAPCATVFEPDSLSVNIEDLKKTLTESFPGCFTKSPPIPSNTSVFHHIPTTSSQPFRTKKRDLPLVKRDAVEKLFLELESSGVIRRSSSPWASAIHVVTKSDGSYRPCGDYRFLNSVTIHDSYPMPLISDIMTKLHACLIFLKLTSRKPSIRYWSHPKTYQKLL